MRKSALLPLFGLMFQVTDGGNAGGSGGSSGGTGQGTGQGSNAPAQGAGSTQSGGAASGGGNAPAHLALSPDSMIIPPGGTTPVKFSDYQRGYVSVADHDRQKADAVKAILTSLAKANKGRANRQPQQQQQPVDPFADVRGVPVMSGDQVAQLGERIQREGLAPLYEYIGQLNPLLEKINQRLQGTERVAGGWQEQQQATEFKGKVGNVLSTVAREVLPGVDISQHSVLSDLAEDVYLSYNPNDPNLEREYPGILKSRIEGLLKLGQAMLDAKMAKAQEVRKNFLRPGGGGQPSGQGGAPRKTHRDIARNYFANDAART